MKRLNFISHQIVTTILLILSVVINLSLAYCLWENRKAYFELGNAIEYDKGVLPGEKVPPLIVYDSTRGKVEISYRDKPTILYVFTPDCPWCLKNLENIKLLASRVSDRYAFFGISLKNDNLDKYVTENGIHFPVYNSPPKDIYRSYKMGQTPQTFVISSEGSVITTWKGAFAGETKKEIEEFFGVGLLEIKRE